MKLTDEQCKALPKGTLVHIIWSGGNHGLYRIEKDKYGKSFAVNAVYYNDDGSEKDPQSIKALRHYNPIIQRDVWDIEIREQ